MAIPTTYQAPQGTSRQVALGSLEALRNARDDHILESLGAAKSNFLQSMSPGLQLSEFTPERP